MLIIACDNSQCKGFLSADVDRALGDDVADRSRNRRHSGADAGNLTVTNNADRFVLARPDNFAGSVCGVGFRRQRNGFPDRFTELCSLAAVVEHLDAANLVLRISRICRGRRRVGKSSLVEEFARRSKVRFIKLEGIAPAESVDNGTQLVAFARQLREQCGGSFPVPEVP